MESGWGCSLIPRPLQLLIIVVLRLTKLFFISVSFESGYHWSYWPCSVRNVCDIVHVSRSTNWQTGEYIYNVCDIVHVRRSTNRQTGEYNHLIAPHVVVIILLLLFLLLLLLLGCKLIWTTAVLKNLPSCVLVGTQFYESSKWALPLFGTGEPPFALRDIKVSVNQGVLCSSLYSQSASDHVHLSR